MAKIEFDVWMNKDDPDIFLSTDDPRIPGGGIIAISPTRQPRMHAKLLPLV